MSQMMNDPNIAALLAGAGQGQDQGMGGQLPPGVLPGAPPDPTQDPNAQQGPDPLQSLQDSIHSTQDALNALPDPQDTQDVAKAMVLLLGVQSRLMKTSGATPQ